MTDTASTANGDETSREVVMILERGGRGREISEPLRPAETSPPVHLSLADRVPGREVR